MRAMWRALCLPVLASSAVLLLLTTLVPPLRAQQTRDTTGRATTRATTGNGTLSPNSICEPGDPRCGGDDTSPPIVSFTPSGGTFTSSTLSVTALFEDDNSLYGSPLISVNNTAINNFTLTSCGTSCEKATFGITLQPGTNSVHASIRDDAGNMGSGSAVYTYTGPAATVSVTPVGMADGGQEINRANSPAQYSFQISSTGGPAGGATYTLQTHCTGVVSCGTTSVSPTSVTVGSGTSQNAVVSYNVGPDGPSGTGTVQLTATYTLNANTHDSGLMNVTALADCSTTTSEIATCSGQTVAVVTTSTTVSPYSFQLTDLSATQPTIYTLTCTPTAPVTACSVSSPVQVNARQTYPVPVTITTNGTEGLGHAHVLATAGTDQVAGTADFQVLSPTSVVLTASAPRTRVDVGATASQPFTVKNAGSFRATYNLAITTCSTSVHPCAVAPSSVTLDPGHDTTVTVSYTGEIAGDTGTVSVKATHNQNSLITSTAWTTVTVNRYGVAVNPKSDSTMVATGPSHSYTFTVTNTGNTTTTYTLSTPCISPVTSCNPSVGSIQIDSGVTKSVSVTYTASVASLSGGVIRLRAAHGTTSLVADTGAVRVSAHTAATGGEPQVALVNSDSLATRDRCLTIAAGPSAAYECGDLRLVHALPSISTRNKARTPVLVYDSRFAEPHPLVAINVTLLPDTVAPDTIEAVLNIDGATKGTTFDWSGSNWVPGTTRRLVVPVDNATLSSGVHNYQLQVINIYPTVQRPAAAVTGRFVVVNRSTSAFGAGWWLGGLEQLVPTTDSTTKLWIGGDGSVRLYTMVASGVWAAPAVDRPDTLTWDGAHYVRHVPHGVQVVFDTAGQHVATVNRLSDTTKFTYDTTGRLKTIVLPPAGQGTTYSFDYSTPGQVKITAPPAGAITRVTTLFLASGRDTTIADWDYPLFLHPAIRFGYDGTSARINARTDKRGTTVSYTYDAGQALHTVSMPLNASKAAVTTFAAAESEGIASAIVRADSVFTLLDGPRIDVRDTTRFWLDRFGEPWKIHDALGHETVLSRTDPDYPALVTRLKQPNGHVMLATYDARGNVRTVTDSALYYDARSTSPDTSSATTTYHWDPKWDFVTQITKPAGDGATFSYDAANGNRLWQQDGRGGQSRVTYWYYTSGSGKGLLAAIEQPGGATDSVTYDGLGNLAGTRTPLKYWTQHYKDGIGRDTLVTSQIDGAATLFDSVKTVYDANGRDSVSQTIGPAMNGAPLQTLTVVQLYDPAGNRLSLARSSSPNSANVGTVTTHWHYDLAGRVDYETAPDGKVDSTHYDAAGNADSVFTRREKIIAMTYDPLNRLATRMIPSVTYHDTLAGIASRDNDPYPRRPSSGTDYVIAAQTESFTYDALGHILTANNADARVTRTYYPDGALESEEQKLRDANDTSFSHDFLLRYSYDLDGHRTAVHLPAKLVLAGTRDSVAWTYSTQTGALSTVTDPLGNMFTYEYDDRNEPISLAYPGSYTERWGYDADGQITGDTIFNLDGTSGSRLQSSLGGAKTFTYDARGKLQTSLDGTGYLEKTESQYTGLGALATDYSWQNGELQGYSITNAYATGEQQSYDALGNMYAAVTVDTQWVGTAPPASSMRNRNATYQPGVGRLLSESSGQGNKTYVYDAAGNLEFSMRDASSQGTALEDRFSYYGADDKVRAADYRVVTNGTVHTSPEKWVFEEYRYDALGRRVWVHTYRDCTDNDTGEFTDAEYMECATSTLRRTVWDGDQELIEIQVPGDDAQPPSVLEDDDFLPNLPLDVHGSDPNPLFGRVVYTHGLGVDQPIAITRYRYVTYYGGTHVDFAPATYSLFWTPLGQMGLALCADGSFRCEENGLAMAIDFPQEFFAYDRPKFVHRVFQGTLIFDKEDAAGTAYRRNRVYDPATGRFTQEDPLGLAGGLNLYGFADGDPINLADPFGLCTDPTDPACASAAEEVLTSLRTKIGNFFNTVTGGFGSLRDFFTHSPTGTTQNAVASAALNPPSVSLGSVDPSVTVSAPYGAAVINKDGIVGGLQPGDEFGFTLDLTYTVPNAPKGPPFSIGAEGGDGVVFGTALNFAGDQFAGFTISLGPGEGAKAMSNPNEKSEASGISPTAFLPLGSWPF